MPLQHKKHRKWLIVSAAVLLTAPPSFALFGLGDIVFDPTSYASLVSQLTTLETQYKMLKNNITHFSLKQQWQSALTTLKNTNVKNLFGETNGIARSSNQRGTSKALIGCFEDKMSAFFAVQAQVAPVLTTTFLMAITAVSGVTCNRTKVE